LQAVLPETGIANCICISTYALRPVLPAAFTIKGLENLVSRSLSRIKAATSGRAPHVRCGSARHSARSNFCPIFSQQPPCQRPGGARAVGAATAINWSAKSHPGLRPLRVRHLFLEVWSVRSKVVARCVGRGANLFRIFSTLDRGASGVSGGLTAAPNLCRPLTLRPAHRRFSWLAKG